MTSFNYTIKNINNIHARPLSDLAKIAKDSKCNVIISDSKKNKKDVKKIIGIMQLNLKIGDEVIVSIEGYDEILENKAKENIYNFFKTNF
ncbi:HPr family phosphocarrier protein [Brachyspira murdochii]|uniref:Phosphotransferase system, phosphocarrier protein HPr n=2 Tax=Brachyspira murdochii TaxID=84378 RepID=D5U7J9_BRAM5|nr:HPr family phosphocarrier protein [Brachyspira murdochii]ADG70787.1 Phosphotransferase system, phosphocarrier protein HPr [Brachyspira murdochii DSM 12563]PPS22895.1 PTS sugar transporter subunit IIBC [Brachyspira murdochii]